MRARESAGQLALAFEEVESAPAPSASPTPQEEPWGGGGTRMGKRYAERAAAFTDILHTHLLHLRFDTMPPSATAQQKGAFVRNGHVHFFTKKRVRQQENNMVALVLSALPKGWKPLEGAVCLHVHLCYPYRKQERKSVIRAGKEIPHDRRPDLDNLLKNLVDSLVTAGLVQDDGQVCDLFATKRRGPRPYWTVDVGRVME